MKITKLYFPEPKTYCTKCLTSTNKNLIHRETVRKTDDGMLFENTIYEMIKCKGCDSVSYRTFYSNPDYVGNDDGHPPYFVSIYPEDMYPNFRPSEYSNLPKKIEEVYVEIVNCVNQGNFILAVAGIRMILEAALKKMKQTSEKPRDFYQLTKLMLKSKIISSQQAEFIHGIRETGNRSVHELEVMHLDDLKKVMPAIDSLLYNCFEMNTLTDFLNRNNERK